MTISQQPHIEAAGKKALCHAHASNRVKREGKVVDCFLLIIASNVSMLFSSLAEEDRLIRVSLFGNINQKKKKRFDHFEERFTDYNQTVLIWYIGDFLGNKKYA
jgi:hypothetical protein